jgi:hypothetical protein
VNRRLLLALCVTALTTSALAWVSTPAYADSRGHYNRACVVAEYGARLRWCRHDDCGRCRHDDCGRCRRDDCDMSVGWGRAFRVKGQSGRHLLVSNWEMEGWIDIGDLRFAPQKFCRAAGI